MLVIVFLSLYEAGFDNNAVYWILLLLQLVVLYSAIKGQLKLDIKCKSPLFWYALFVLWAGVSIFWSINPHRTLVEFIQISLYGFVFLLSGNISEENLIRVGRIALITAVGVSLFGISQYLLLDSSRIVSTIGNANSLGIYLSMIFLAGWSYNLRKPWRFGYVVCILLFITLILTISRGALIALAVSLPIIFLGIQKNKFKNAILKTAICLAIGLAFSQLLVYIAPFLKNLSSENLVISYILTRNTPMIAWSGVSRFAFWEAGIKVFLSNPFAGTGLGTFFLAYFTEFTDNIWYSRFVHNHYVQIMSELGIIGITLFVAFILSIAKAVWNTMARGSYPAYYPGMLAAAIAFLIHIGGDFSWNFPGVAVLFFFITGTISSQLNSDQTKPNINVHKLPIFLAIIALIFTLSIWQLSANLLYKKAILLEADHEIEQAIDTYNLVNRIYPINSIAFNFASNAYYHLYRSQNNIELLNEALIRAKRAMELSPVDGSLHNILGRLYWETGHVSEAEKHLKKATDYAAYRIGFFVDLAWLYIQQERCEEAQIIIDRGFELSKYAVGMHPTDRDRERVDAQIALLNHLQEILDDHRSHNH